MRFSILSAALCVAAYALDQGWITIDLPLATLVWTSRGVFGVAFLLAWRFRRGRLAAASLTLALVTESLAITPAVLNLSQLPVVTFLLPLNLAALAMQAEWRVTSHTGWLWCAALIMQSFAVFAIARGELASLHRVLLHTLFESLPTLRLPQVVWLGFALPAFVIAICWWRRGTPVEGGLMAALVTGLLAFELAREPRIFLAAGGMILVLAQIENAFSLAFEDGLTGLPARRALEESLRHPGRRYAIAMVDIDHFKRLNDRHGHEVGDQVLRSVASRLAKVRGGTAYRYGGEEFTLLFPRRSAKDVAAHLEDLRRSIADQPFVVRGPARPKKKPRKRGGGSSTDRKLKVTASFGVADRNPKRRTTEQVLKAADKALYRSKRAGRNRLTIS